MANDISAKDIVDDDVVDQEELASRGYLTAAYESYTLVSTTTGSNLITISGGDFNDRDCPVEIGDLLRITGSTAADGDYTVNAILSDTTLDVVESIPTSTGGTLDVYHPVGCSRIGYDGAIPNASDICSAIDVAYTESATSIPPMFISESPSDVPEIFGYRDQGYKPRKKIRLAGLFLYTRKTGGASKDIRARIFKWDGVAGVGYLAFLVRIDNVTGAQSISDQSSILETAGADIIDPALNDRVYGLIDDGTGPDTNDTIGTQPDPKFSQINYIPETGAL